MHEYFPGTAALTSEGAPLTGTKISLILVPEFGSRASWKKILESVTGVATIRSGDRPNEFVVYISVWDAIASWELTWLLERVHDDLFKQFRNTCHAIEQKRERQTQEARQAAASSEEPTLRVVQGRGRAESKGFVNTSLRRSRR